MIDEFTIRHYEHVSARSFDEVVAALEGAVGTVEGGKFRAEIEGAKNATELEGHVHSHEGASGFMRFLTVDHGAWLAHKGLNAKARMYTIGNPLIAHTIIKFNIGVGLNVPIRLMIYEDAVSGTARLAYDLPSSLMSRLGNDDVTAAARQLDAKLIALAELATSASA
jgi:uncharacterized protein (DUF302 family)